MLRFGAEEFPVRSGDFIACPPAERTSAHQLINTGAVDLRYLAVSTLIGTDSLRVSGLGQIRAGVRFPQGRVANVIRTANGEEIDGGSTRSRQSTAELEHFGRATSSCDACASVRCSARRTSGYSYDVVPPGKRSCPFHSHRAEEEMFFIVKGAGTLRYGERDAKDPRRRLSSAARPADRRRRTRSSTTRTRTSRTCRSAP